jgi:hypothetical protein
MTPLSTGHTTTRSMTNPVMDSCMGRTTNAYLPALVEGARLAGG